MSASQNGRHHGTNIIPVSLMSIIEELMNDLYSFGFDTQMMHVKAKGVHTSLDGIEKTFEVCMIIWPRLTPHTVGHKAAREMLRGKPDMQPVAALRRTRNSLRQHSASLRISFVDLSSQARNWMKRFITDKVKTMRNPFKKDRIRESIDTRSDGGPRRTGKPSLTTIAETEEEGKGKGKAVENTWEVYGKSYKMTRLNKYGKPLPELPVEPEEDKDLATDTTKGKGKAVAATRELNTERTYHGHGSNFPFW